MDELATVAAAIGDPLRVRILDLLAAGRRDEPCCSPDNPEAPAAVCACDIAPALGGLSPSKLAYHLGLLRAAGLVTERRRGKWVYYSVNEPAVAELAAAIGRRWAAAPRRAGRPPITRSS
jgi:ArsR family transcriptional regulator, arsenate/arsenite/antimonite-responsive transcriptional repressor